MEDKNLDAVKRACSCQYYLVKIPRVVGGPLAKKSAAKRRALLPAWERRAEPWSIISTEGTTLVARLGDGTALGATPSRLGAAEGIGSGLTARVKKTR